MTMKIKYSKELQQKLDEITPKLKFLHCVAAIEFEEIVENSVEMCKKA